MIGTVLQQNQPFNDYLIEFGPFWFEVFNTLGLYDVYSVGWFVAILLFLLASTSACLIRNTPGFMRDIRSFRLNAQDKSLRAFAHSRQYESACRRRPSSSAPRACSASWATRHGSRNARARPWWPRARAA